MAGLFDDLVPVGPKQGTAQTRTGGLSFDDLIPQAPQDGAPLSDGSTPLVINVSPRRAPKGPAPETLEAAKAETAAPATPQAPGWLETLGRGLYQGVTLNFGDESKGLAAASGLPDAVTSIPIGPASGLAQGIGALRLGGEAIAPSIFGSSATQAYNQRVAQERAANEAAQKANPWTYAGGQIAGGFALPGGALASSGIRGAAAVGAATGALSGAGEGVGAGDRLSQAATGGVLGGALGAGTSAALTGIGMATSPLVNNFRNQWRGLTNRDAEAARRIGAGFERDRATGQLPTLPGGAAPATPGEALTNLQRFGQPAVLADAGGEAIRNLARSAANTSDAASGALVEATMPRFSAQASRIVDWFRGKTGVSGDVLATRQGLEAAARRVNNAAYRRAHAEGARGIWDSDLAALTAAPSVQKAIDSAEEIGKNAAAIEGHKAVQSPFVKQSDGTFALKTNPDGSRAIPNLQFWDYVKRGLDKEIGTAQRAGNDPGARQAVLLKNALLEKLDAAAPSYKAARAGAARFFGAENASEAGEKFLNANAIHTTEARRAMGKMSPAEQRLFQEGFVSAVISKLQGMGDRRDAVNGLFASPVMRERIEIALGPKAAKELEAFLHVENLMTRFQRAVTGNSSTIKQYMALGLAGGFGQGLVTGDWSPGNMSLGAMFSTMVKAGHSHIDQRVAQRVGEMLASSDPNVLNKGLEQVARQPKLLQLVQRAADLLERAAAQPGAAAAHEVTPSVQRFLGTQPGFASQDQQQR